MDLVAPHWRRYLDHIEAGHEYDEWVDSYRWLLEEYRISIFAQPLKTAVPVSPRRLKTAWRTVPQPI